MIRAYIAAAFAGFLSILGALLYYMGVKAKESEAKDADIDAAKKSKENRYEIENADDQYIVDILTGKLRDR